MVPEKMRGPKKRHQMAASPGFKSHCQSSSVAPFPAPPTIGHSCQQSRQVWPCGVEPIISKLFWTHYKSLFGAPLGCTLLQKNINWFPPIDAPTGNRTHDLGRCPGQVAPTSQLNYLARAQSLCQGLLLLLSRIHQGLGRSTISPGSSAFSRS